MDVSMSVNVVFKSVSLMPRPGASVDCTLSLQKVCVSSAPSGFSGFCRLGRPSPSIASYAHQAGTPKVEDKMYRPSLFGLVQPRMWALPTSRTSTQGKPTSPTVPSLSSFKAKPIDSPSLRSVLAGPKTKEGQMVTILKPSLVAISHAAFSAKALDSRYAPASRVEVSFQSASENFPSSRAILSLPVKPEIAAQLEVSATHLMSALCFATDPRTFFVPSTAGLMSFASTASGPSDSEPRKKGDAVWNTYSQPCTTGSKAPSVRRSALKSSSLPGRPSAIFLMYPTLDSSLGSRTVPRTVQPSCRHWRTTSEATYPVQPVTQTTLAIADKRETARTEGGAE
mmetsp:Transcript_72203/g.169202  ORF Transcript_72203/g.169202 Transcript_72203/m.169202 type:complete len:340 (+) Transcript_72203:237-1256(+)